MGRLSAAADVVRREDCFPFTQFARSLLHRTICFPFFALKINNFKVFFKPSVVSVMYKNVRINFPANLWRHLFIYELERSQGKGLRERKNGSGRYGMEEMGRLRQRQVINSSTCDVARFLGRTANCNCNSLN